MTKPPSPAQPEPVEGRAPASPSFRTIRSAWVIGRRDFVAVIFSKTFLFFLLGPLFPILVAGLAGGIGNQVARSIENPQLGVAMSSADSDAFLRAHRLLRDRMAGRLPELVVLEPVPLGEKFDPAEAMGKGNGRLAAIVSGTLDHPRLTGTAEKVERWQGMVATLAATGSNRSPGASCLTTSRSGILGPSCRTSRCCALTIRAVSAGLIATPSTGRSALACTRCPIPPASPPTNSGNSGPSRKKKKLRENRIATKSRRATT